MYDNVRRDSLNWQCFSSVAPTTSVIDSSLLLMYVNEIDCIACQMLTFECDIHTSFRNRSGMVGIRHTRQNRQITEKPPWLAKV